MPLHGNPKDWVGKSFIAHNPRVIVRVVEARRRLLVLEYLGGDASVLPKELVYTKNDFARYFEPYNPARHGPIEKHPPRPDLH